MGLDTRARPLVVSTAHDQRLPGPCAYSGVHAIHQREPAGYPAGSRCLTASAGVRGQSPPQVLLHLIGYVIYSLSVTTMRARTKRRTIKIPEEVYDRLAAYSDVNGETLQDSAAGLLGEALTSEDYEGPDPDEQGTQLLNRSLDGPDDLRSRLDRLEQQHAGILGGQQAGAQASGYEKEWADSVRRAVRGHRLSGGTQKMLNALPGAVDGES